jgi:hypothetical protein
MGGISYVEGQMVYVVQVNEWMKKMLVKIMSAPAAYITRLYRSQHIDLRIYAGKLAEQYKRRMGCGKPQRTQLAEFEMAIRSSPSNKCGIRLDCSTYNMKSAHR